MSMSAVESMIAAAMLYVLIPLELMTVCAILATMELDLSVVSFVVVVVVLFCFCFCVHKLKHK